MTFFLKFLKKLLDYTVKWNKFGLLKKCLQINNYFINKR